MTSFFSVSRWFPCRPVVALLSIAALAISMVGFSAQAQDKKDDKKDDKANVQQDKKDDKAKDQQDKKDDKAKDQPDKKKDAAEKKKDDKAKAGKKKDNKKDDAIKIVLEKRDERVYPKVEPVLELKGHSDWIYHVFYTPDGKNLVTAGRDKTLRIWDAGSGKEVLKIKDLPASAVALALSPDGSKLATTSGKWDKDKKQWLGEIDIYDAKTGKPLTTVKGHAEPIDAVAFGPAGATLATASKDGTAKVWNTADGKEIHNLKGHAGPVAAVVFSPDGKWIATGGEDKIVKIWDAANGTEAQSLKGPGRAISCLEFSKDGKLLAAGSQDGTATLWDTADWKTVHVLKADDGVLTTAFSPDSTKLATGGWFNVVKIWDVKSGKELGGLAGHTKSVSSVVFNSGGDLVVSASLDQTVRIWNVSAVKPGVEPVNKDEKKEEKKDEVKK